jgi:hypothetical protein
MPSLENKKRSSLLKFLREIGESGTASEFEALLIKYRSDEEAREALETGIKNGNHLHDSGSYCESASPGWPNHYKKMQTLKDFYLDRGAFANLPTIETAAANTNKEPSLKDIFAALQKIETRLDTLEQQPRVKGKKTSLSA